MESRISHLRFMSLDPSCGGKGATLQRLGWAGNLSASTGFRLTSIMKANASVTVSVLLSMSGDYRGSPENVCSSVDNRSSAAGGKGPFSTAASAFSN